MIKRKIRVPLPSRIIFQYRLMFLVIMGLGVIGTIYLPHVSDEIKLSPLIDSCSIATCKDICLDNGDKQDCFCDNERCTCNPPAPFCRPSLGEQCRVNAVSGDAFCARIGTP